MCMTSFVRQEEEVSPPTVTCSHLLQLPRRCIHTRGKKGKLETSPGGTLSGNERKNTLRIDYSLLLQLYKHMQMVTGVLSTSFCENRSSQGVAHRCALRTSVPEKVRNLEVYDQRKDSDTDLLPEV